MPFVKQRTAADAQRDAEFGERRRQFRRSDLVMVFPYKVDAKVRYGEASVEEERRGLRPPSEAETHKMESWQAKRAAAIHSLSDAGLILMIYYSRDRDEIFVKIAADEQHMRQVAEMVEYKLELKQQYLSAYAPYKNDYPGRREVNYSDRVIVSHLYKTHMDDDSGEYPQPDAIFRTIDRIQLINYIVRNAGHNCAALDVGQLMHDRDLLHFFPLHENKSLADLDGDWFKAFAWGEHIEKVRDYFGENVAMYFLFMSHMNKWLVIPSVVGFLVFIVNIIFGTPDNVCALLLCIGTGCWCTLFVPFWRRNAATHALKWGTLGIGRQLEPTRPEFVGVSRLNPVTGRVDRYYPWSERIKMVLFSYTVILVALIILIFVVCMLFFFRHLAHTHLVGGAFIFMVINAIVVEIMNTLFTSIAKALTDRENHRARSEYANHLMAKTVVFKFINCYVSLYYIAFFKDNNTLFGVHTKCLGDHDCMLDLGWQLAVFMLSRVTLQNFAEIGVPWLYMRYRNAVEGRQFHTSLFTNPLTVMPDMSIAEKQAKKEEYDLYEDMDEILILYGYTTLFVVACPWVPLVALFSSILECFLDQKKLIFLYRRPFPTPAANNEPWDTAFDVFGIIAMITNTAVVVFASKLFEDWLAWHKILLFLLIEHAMVILRLVVDQLLPAVPREVRILQMQQKVVVHRHLDLGGQEDDTDTRANALIQTGAPPPYVHDQDEDELEDW